MGKAKKKAASDKVRKNKPTRDIKANPFEVKINKQKFDILGRKTKHDRGLPGVSRSKSIKKRTETLLKEYQSQGKTNTFIDKRFGEYDTELTEDEKMAKRFSLERQRLHTKKSIYNLNEDEDLTHYGQSLADIETFNDRPDSDSDTEEKGKLSAEFTAAAHFGGGGLLQKKASSKGDEEEQKPKSRREFIEELIIKSKKEKHERQVQRDKAQELTEKLDKDWKEIHSLLAQKGPKIEPVEEKPKAGDYDIIVRELFFDAKAPASDRLKTKEELAKEEQENLQKLEMERLRRMRGDFEDKVSKTQKHLSADDLNDGFILDKVDKPCLVYKDGKLEQPEDEEEEQGDENDPESREDGDSDEAEDEEDGEDVDSDEGEDEEENESDEDEEKNESDEDDYSDLGDEDRSELDSESESEEGKGEGEGVAAESIPRKERAPSEEARKAMMEAAKAELPFTFSVPKSYEDLKSLLTGQDAEKQCLIVERIRKSNHPSVAAENKAKLENFFGFLWAYVGELATRQPAELKVIDGMVPQLYDLSQMFPEAACSLAQSTLRQSMQELEDQLRSKGRACFPKLDKLTYLKITGALFPTSDFRHPVVTPALVHLSQMLTKCSVTSLREVAAGLFVCCLFLDFVSFSKRFIPEVINFLLGILHLAVPSKDNLEYTVIPPFKAVGKSSDLLVQKDTKAAESWEMKPLPMSWMHGVRPCDELQVAHFRFTCVAMCFNLCKKCCSLYRTLPAFQEIIQPLEKLLTSHLPMNDYPAQLQELYHEVLREIRDRPSCYQPLTFEKKKPVPLRFFTPKIVEVTDYGRKRGSTQQERERMRLIHKHKREFKGAIREIRKDAQFLARQKLSDIMQRDSERKRKVQMLMGSLATQEGEWKAMKRMKKKL
ncbi:nucleolar protein 14 [Hypanus sabinus]|uniref:nucleolar protein 14 n=1 Tax=Hypanus sabinus TaxID=79690 RepID=UPI0028C37C13|nr:nucleolar protein 14 [Hypanus sabinus]XP_059830131.1 nucleolar protein 14 [Hypanus sabinus]XP_059830133.1 nucleolar protein 14 [Hypanus sabinus]XP_059830134.1 nucleolar protein 14 [Hypanus sabinus]